MILKGVFFFTILFYFTLPSANGFNFTQSIVKAMINHFVHEFALLTDLEIYVSLTKTVRRYGYPIEAHTIATEDDYLLEYHRIPRGKNKQKATKPYPILLHHGLLSSSIDWLIQGPEKSLAYQLADLGYDVWMGNSRGNTYSRYHMTLNNQQEEFWNFTFHEMGTRDLTAGIDYILDVTGKDKLIYIGHSQGTTIFYVLMSSRPEYNEKVLFQISAAPVGTMPHTTSPIRYYAPYAETIGTMVDWFKKGAFMEHDSAWEVYMQIQCHFTIFDFNLCEKSMFSMFGDSPQQFQPSLLPTIFNHMPAGSATKNMIHMAQLITSETFSQFNSGNGQPLPYDLSKITVPVMFLHGMNDLLANPTDVNLLYQKIPNPLGCDPIGHDFWNHVDFIYGVDTNPLFNDIVIKFLQNAYEQPDFIQRQVQKARQERNERPPIVNESLNNQNSTKLKDIPMKAIQAIVKQIQDFFKRQMKAMSFTLSKTTQLMSQMIDKSTVLADGTVELAKETLEGMKEVDSFFKETAGKAGEVVEGVVKGAAEDLKEATQNVKDKTESALKGVSDAFKKPFSFGFGKNTEKSAPPTLTGH